MRVTTQLSVVLLARLLAAPAISQEPPDTLVPDTSVAPLIPARELEIGALYQTRGGYAACLARPRFDEMMEAIAFRNSEKFRSMVSDPRETGCFMLNGEIEVRLLTNGVTFVELKPTALDLTIWTVLEALAPLPSDTTGNS